MKTARQHKNPQLTAKRKLHIVGHRGVRGLAPEHTAAAISKALQAGVNEIEVDVRATKDGAIVLHHNPTSQAVNGKKVLVRQLTLKDFKHRQPDALSLSEAIELIARRVPLQVEIKAGEPVKPVVDVIKRFMEQGWQASDFLIGSKSQRNLLQAHKLLPEVEKVVIEACFSVIAVRRARQVGATRLSMQEHWLWGGFIRAMDRRGFQLYAYPLNDPAKAARWHKQGLAGAITDRPDSFR